MYRISPPPFQQNATFQLFRMLSSLKDFDFLGFAMPVASIGSEVVALILAPLWLLGALAIFWYIVRAINWAVRPHGGNIPVVVQVSGSLPNNGSQADERAEELAACVKRYISGDVQIPTISSPGGLRPSTPPVPSGTSESPEGAIATLISKAASDEPQYEVFLTPTQRLDDDTPTLPWHSIGIEIIRKPKGRLIAAHIVERPKEEELVEEIGSYCLHKIRGQRKFLNNIPRWDSWGNKSEAYKEYRRGVGLQDQEEYEEALKSYMQGISLAPGNLALRSAKAQLHELMGNELAVTDGRAAQEHYLKAISEYEACRDIWPESVEVGYRMAIAIANWIDIPESDEDEHWVKREAKILSELREERLLWRKIFVKRICASRPGYRNAGERFYWKSWNKRRVVSHRLTTERKRYLKTIEISETVMRLKALKRRYEKIRRIPTPAMALAAINAELWKLIDEMLHHIGGRRVLSGKCRLIVNDFQSASFTRKNYKRLAHRRGIGWIAHYNSACFFSRALEMSSLFNGTESNAWKEDCKKAALSQLAMVCRDPRARPVIRWHESDPDLQPLRNCATEYDRFFGTPPRYVVPQFPGQLPLF
ncbi:hypothetical protein [Streptomyces sp. NPDC002676]